MAYVEAHAHARSGGKTALIAPNDLEFGPGRMLDAYAEMRQDHFEVRSFRTGAEALAWLGLDALPEPE